MREIVFIGDVAFTGIISSDPQKNQERYSWISPLLRDNNYVFANLEVPVRINNERNEHKNTIHYSELFPTECLLKLLNISCVSLANNHIFDCKMSGMTATINLLDRLGIYHTGAGWTKEHLAPVIIVNDGVKIGFLAYVEKSTNPKTENFPELLINYFDTETVKKDILELKPKVDKILCSIHWGIDYSYYPTPEQVKVAREIVECGADIIMGHHPHTFQPFEKHKGGYIFYSLGSFTFGDYVKNGDTELHALFRKTKKFAVVKYDIDTSHAEFLAARELKGNFIRSDKRDYEKWSRIKWKHFRIRSSSGLTEGLYDFHEKVLYRIFEYFFGYYRNPFKRLIQLKNLPKIVKLIR